VSKEKARSGEACKTTQRDARNRRLKFHKRSRLFIRTRNETLSIVAMCVNNPEFVGFMAVYVGAA
jgi:hypothetical protein